MRDILIYPPKLPQVRGGRTPSFRLGFNQLNGLANAWPAAPLLMPPVDQIAIGMEDIGNPLPVDLEPAKRSREPAPADDALLHVLVGIDTPDPTRVPIAC